MAVPKTIIWFVVFCFGMTLQSGSQEKQVLTELDSLAFKMFQKTNDRDFDGLIEMTHPKIFELVPKATMVSLFKSMFEGTEAFKVDMPKLAPEYELSEVFKDEENGSNFAFLNYDMSMTMTFINEEFDKESKEMMKTMMALQGMEVAFVSNKKIDVFMPNRMVILINDESTKNKWAMLNYDPDSPLFYQILSTSILEKAKSYHQDLMIKNKKKN